MQLNSRITVALLAAAGAVLFIPLLGNVHLFDWDEVNFAECAREMVVSGDYSHVQVNFRPFWEKPPFFIWMQALSMNVFGVNEFAARFPNAVCSIATLIALFYAGRKFHSPKFGLTWALVYAASLLPHLYFRSGLIDPWFNLFNFLSVYHAIFVINDPAGSRARARGTLSGLFLGLAVLTKGPAALIVCGLTIAIAAIRSRERRVFTSSGFYLFIVATLLVSASWFIVEWMKGNSDIIVGFIEYQKRLLETGDAGHDGPWYYHIVVLLLGCFPASLIFIANYSGRAELTPFQLLFRNVMLALFWVVLVLFSIVKTKIVHYSSLCYFPLTFIAALGVLRAGEMGRGTRAIYRIVAGLISLAYLGVTTIEHYKTPLLESGLIRDAFAVQNLSAEVSWTGAEPFFVLLFLAASFLVYSGFSRGNASRIYTGMLLQVAFLWLAIAFIIPRVEMYTQHAAIAFYKACAKRSCYVETHGYKSYAYLFYSERTPADYVNEDQRKFVDKQLDAMVKQGHSRLSSFATANLLWMEHGEIDRPAFIVIKTPAEAELFRVPGMRKLYDRNGYSFFARLPRGD